MTQAEHLCGLIAAAVGRNVFVSIPRFDDKSGWRVDANPPLTEAELNAARGVIDAYDATKPPPKTIFDGAEFLSRLTDSEYGAILEAAKSSVQLARWLDIFRLRGEIDVTGTTALAAKAGLVAMGLISQERANAIFAAA